MSASNFIVSVPRDLFKGKYNTQCGYHYTTEKVLHERGASFACIHMLNLWGIHTPKPKSYCACRRCLGAEHCRL